MNFCLGVLQLCHTLIRQCKLLFFFQQGIPEVLSILFALFQSLDVSIVQMSRHIDTHVFEFVHLGSCLDDFLSPFCLDLGNLLFVISDLDIKLFI